jgi:hypothetical protein
MDHCLTSGGRGVVMVAMNALHATGGILIYWYTVLAESYLRTTDSQPSYQRSVWL